MDAILLPEGAGFSLQENLGICPNRYYLYSPSHPNMTFGMSPMLNSLIYLFAHRPPRDLAEAWALFRRSGLTELAEREAIFVAIPLPLNGEGWTEADYDAYYNIQYVLSGGHIEFHGAGTPPILQYTRYVYNNKQFVVGEGDGATFINNVLSRRCNRIAGACTFGGEMEPALPAGMPLPIYAVDPCPEAVDYYRRANQADTRSFRF